MIFFVVDYIRLTCIWGNKNMKDSKLLNYAGILIAIDIPLWGKVSLGSFIIINIAIFFACVLLSRFESFLDNFPIRWINAVFYFFSRTKKNYIIEHRGVTYHIKDTKNATYKEEVALKVLKERNFKYEGRYCWDQDDIDVSIIQNDVPLEKEESQDYKWSKVTIKPQGYLKDKNLHTGFCLNNLKINSLKQHTFISCKVSEKIKNLKFKAIVDKSLNPPKTASYVIENAIGEEIEVKDDIKLVENGDQMFYELEIPFPRKGRKYILKWDLVNKKDEEVS